MTCWLLSYRNDSHPSESRQCRQASSMTGDKKQENQWTVSLRIFEVCSTRPTHATTRGSKETDEMGQSVLANQFAAGLLPELKAKVAGSEGNMDKLLTKARCEEAKLWDL